MQKKKKGGGTVGHRETKGENEKPRGRRLSSGNQLKKSPGTMKNGETRLKSRAADSVLPAGQKRNVDAKKKGRARGGKQRRGCGDEEDIIGRRNNDEAPKQSTKKRAS